MIRAIGSWAFSAHDYSEEDLVHVAFFILQHALAMPELEKWRLPAGRANAVRVQIPTTIPSVLKSNLQV